MSLADGTAWEKDYPKELVLQALNTQPINTFMIKITIKNSELSGYQWTNNKQAHLDSFIQIKALTLKEAVEITKIKYGDKDKYWIKPDESYMILE